MQLDFFFIYPLKAMYFYLFPIYTIYPRAVSTYKCVLCYKRFDRHVLIWIKFE